MIRYTHLTIESRAHIWRNFLQRVPRGVDIGEEGIRALAKHDLNGRQIKNVVKAAESLAAFEGGGGGLGAVGAGYQDSVGL